MEENIDITELFKIQKPEPINYYAEFDFDTGAIIKVGPEHAFENVKYKIPVPEDTAVNIINGVTKMTNCSVDIIENKFYLAEIRNAVKIDDVLHRIVEQKYSAFDYPHILLTYNSNKKTIKIQMSELFFGTCKIPKKFLPVEQRRLHWTGDTNLIFYVTAYNDPTVIFETFSVCVNELKEKDVTVELSNVKTDFFSVFTRRMFKCYELIKK